MHLLISVPGLLESFHVAMASRFEPASAVRRALSGLFYDFFLAIVSARLKLLKPNIGAKSRANLLRRIIDALQFTVFFPLYLLEQNVMWSRSQTRL